MSDAPPRILYVDDDEALRRLVQRALGRRGFTVELAADAGEAMRCLRESPFALVAVDHHMPGKDGLDLLAEIIALPSAPPVVFVTGTDETRVAVSALKSGAADFVVKSVGEDFFDLLASSFAAALEKRALAEAKASAEAELTLANERLQTLLSECNHRVANSLQLVSAFVSMQAANSPNAEAREALAETQRRIQAVVQVHRRLYTSNHADSIELDEYLAMLVEELRRHLSTAERKIDLALEAERVTLKPDHAVSIGIIVTELVSNAAKYAFDGSGGGSIRISVDRAAKSGFRIAVNDDGCGFDPARPVRGTGLGMRIVEAMAKSLRSKLVRAPTEHGTRFEIAIPG